MTNKIIFKNIFLGFLSWLIPFVVSFLFYKPGGELVVPYATFKCIIMAVGTLSGCFLLYQFFKSLESSFFLHGVIVGICWFAINILLDVIILVPMMKTSFADYFMSIGLGYVAIPMLSITIGLLLARKMKK